MPNTPEPTSSATLNRLRAAVLGANDGIVSTASVLMGVAGANANSRALFIAGMAALVAGALSMAVGEYVSVSSQRDAEKVNSQLNKNETDADEAEYTNPWHAAIASLIAFTIGGAIPLIAIIVAPGNSKVPITIIAVLVALVVTGYFSASVGGASRRRAIMRVITGGLIAMAVTYFIGVGFGTLV